MRPRSRAGPARAKSSSLTSLAHSRTAALGAAEEKLAQRVDAAASTLANHQYLTSQVEHQVSAAKDSMWVVQNAAKAAGAAARDTSASLGALAARLPAVRSDPAFVTAQRSAAETTRLYNTSMSQAGSRPNAMTIMARAMHGAEQVTCLAREMAATVADGGAYAQRVRAATAAAGRRV